MSIQQRGRQENKGSRMNNRAHDSPEGEKAKRARSGTSKPKEIEMIEDWLSSVRFKKTGFGGVNESDVWKKISELNEMYQTALTAERARYDMLLQMYEKRRVSETSVRRRSPESAAPRTHAEAVPVSSRSRDAPKQAETKVINRTSSPPKKSARPKGIPFTEVDWLDDDGDDWPDPDIGTVSPGKTSNSRSREGCL